MLNGGRVGQGQGVEAHSLVVRLPDIDHRGEIAVLPIFQVLRPPGRPLHHSHNAAPLQLQLLHPASGGSLHPLQGLVLIVNHQKILEAIQALAAENKSLKEGGQPGTDTTVANKAVCELLGLKAGAPTEDVTARIMELKSGTIDGVNVLAELKTLKAQAAQRDAEEAVTLALKTGRITPAQRDWARSYALADPTGFGAFLEKAPQVVPMGELELGDLKALKSDAVDDATQLVCRQLGVTQEDLEKYGKEA